MSQIEWLSARQAYLDSEELSLIKMREFYDLSGLGTAEKNLYYEIGNDYREMVSPIPSVYKRIDKETIFSIGNLISSPRFCMIVFSIILNCSSRNLCAPHGFSSTISSIIPKF